MNNPLNGVDPSGYRVFVGDWEFRQGEKANNYRNLDADGIGGDFQAFFNALWTAVKNGYNGSTAEFYQLYDKQIQSPHFKGTIKYEVKTSQQGTVTEYIKDPLTGYTIQVNLPYAEIIITRHYITISNNPTSIRGSVDFCLNKISSNELIGRLQDFAHQTGYDISIVGGDRSAARNKLVGGANNSRHLYGDAADFVVKDNPNREIAIQTYFSGLFNTTIYYPSYSTPGALGPHVHVDLNPRHNNVLMIYKIVNGSNKYFPWDPFDIY